MSNTGPILIELGTEPEPDVAAAPPIEDAPQGLAMEQALGRMAAGGAAGPGGWLLASAASLAGLVLGLALWDYVTGLLARVPVLGWVAAGLSAVLVAALALWALREALGIARLKRLDALRKRAEAALAARDLGQARGVAALVAGLYGVQVGADDALDAVGVIEAAETRCLAGLDALALAEVQSAARQVAMATALIPLPLADMAAALASNLRMIRRIATLYGGRPGALGNWSLARAVAGHMLATGAIALGDDVIGSLAGGGLVSKLSRRFGEGVVNGALTARVGLAAMDLCRPLPWRVAQRPGVSVTTAAALRGLFGRG